MEPCKIKETNINGTIVEGIYENRAKAIKHLCEKAYDIRTKDTGQKYGYYVSMHSENKLIIGIREGNPNAISYTIE